MAATEYARGRIITVKPVPEQIMFFSLAQAFHWLPSQIKREDTKDMKGITHILSIYNRIKNKETESISKKSKR